MHKSNIAFVELSCIVPCRKGKHPIIMFLHDVFGSTLLPHHLLHQKKMVALPFSSTLLFLWSFMGENVYVYLVNTTTKYIGEGRVVP